MSYLDSNYYDCNKNDEMGLEPRLLEYIKKRKFFKENNINNDYLDKEFAITKTDISKIKAYMKGDKKNYTDNHHSDYVDMSSASFPSSELKKDPRLDRIKAKQKKETEASEQRHDYNIISKSYDMYRSDRPFASASGNDFSKSSFHPNEWFKNSKDEMTDLINNNNNNNDFVPKKSYSNSNTYVNPRSSYNGYFNGNHNDQNNQNNQNNHTIDDIIGKIDSYKKESGRVPNRGGSNDYNYKPVPYMGNNFVNNDNNNNNIKTLDIDVDSNMKFGLGNTPLRAGKSLGYPNTIEHSFSYISPDIQDPNHVVMDRGIPSRAFNKETARPYSNRNPMR